MRPGSCAFLALAICAAAAAGSVPERTGMTQDFRPELTDLRLEPRVLAPGHSLALSLTFVNRGGTGAAGRYLVFVHFEHPEKDCGHIVFQYGYEPALPTIGWEPGKPVAEGPHAVTVPADAAEGEYWVHVGVWDRKTGQRYVDTYPATITVDASAPGASPQLSRLPEPERARRLAALEERLRGAARIENDDLRLAVSRRTGAWAVTDRATDVTWHSSPYADRLGVAVVRRGDAVRALTLDAVEDIAAAPSSLTLWPALPDEFPAKALAVTWRLDGGTLEMAYEAEGVEVESIRLLDDALWTSDAESGSLVVPSRLGLLLPADSGYAYTSRHRTYRWGGCQMEMFGVAKRGATALVNWDDPYVDLEVRSIVGDEQAPGAQVVSASLILSKTARRLWLRFPGPGDYVTIAKAYREVARERGLLVPWQEKVRECAHAALLFGAPEFKPFTLSRHVKTSRYFSGRGEEDVYVGYTFDEAAQVAEHLKREVGIDRALFVLAGWIHRGYDNQHPDILPAAPECGGDEALADCSRRVRALGYLFGLHDNYQDMYKNAPSWDERYIMKFPGGGLVPGGNWGGGQAWLTCSKRALELAHREQNLPAVRRLFQPTAYFIDTTFAAEPKECFDPDHPLTRSDDLRCKAALCDCARSLFGVHGSEEGMEWAVPHSDYFEGILSPAEDRGLPPAYGRTVPLFELVYRDAIALYTHQGDRAGPASADDILRLISLGRTPLYAIGPHLYWREETEVTPPARPPVAEVRPLGPRRFAITYAWQVERRPSADWSIFVHFTDDRGEIKFQDDHAPDPPTSAWQPGSTVRIGPHQVEVPQGLKGEFDIRIGFWVPQSGVRAFLLGRDDGQRRYSIGRLIVRRGEIRFEPPAADAADPACFARAEGGFAEDLALTDRFIRNTYEVMSPLNAITATMPMTDHRFLTPDGLVERTEFACPARGNAVLVITNRGPAPYRAQVRGDEVKLPQYGFVVDSQTFRAFHALSWGGLSYDQPVLFAVRALDGRPIEQSLRTRIYHAFGDPRLRLAGRTYQVARERVVGPGREPPP